MMRTLGLGHPIVKHIGTGVLFIGAATILYRLITSLSSSSSAAYARRRKQLAPRGFNKGETDDNPPSDTRSVFVKSSSQESIHMKVQAAVLKGINDADRIHSELESLGVPLRQPSLTVQTSSVGPSSRIPLKKGVSFVDSKTEGPLDQLDIHLYDVVTPSTSPAKSPAPQSPKDFRDAYPSDGLPSVEEQVVLEAQIDAANS